MRQQRVAGVRLDPQLVLLRLWQSQRLAQTSADRLAAPRSGPALRFFVSDIAALRDFSQRDHDVERIAACLSRVMPVQTLHVLTDVILLKRLPLGWDTALCRVLGASWA